MIWEPETERNKFLPAGQNAGANPQQTDPFDDIQNTLITSKKKERESTRFKTEFT